ncbi:hypothetical protein [Caenibacillus caldisaponilyticus]|uniref:hypothetical protein n=1 Tax=Caenibacillus caldisaponilyticus TaxID=1674942 RepID=UPI000988849A|nr:hypothetical protein [Caenibacillus caldisaponilyticus]
MGSSFDRLVWELRLFFGPAGLAIAPTVNNGDGVIAMIKRRIAVVGAALLCTAAMLIVRLAQIQLFDTESFSNEKINLIDKSIEQRTTAFIVDDGRGVIADRNGEILNVKEKKRPHFVSVFKKRELAGGHRRRDFKRSPVVAAFRR